MYIYNYICDFSLVFVAPEKLSRKHSRKDVFRFHEHAKKCEQLNFFHLPSDCSYHFEFCVLISFYSSISNGAVYLYIAN